MNERRSASGSMAPPTPAPVPALLHGAWRRVSIVDADGTTDTTSTVLWLQLESLMVDVRLPADIAGLRDRGGLEACSLEDLRRLTACEASTGRTTCTEVAFDGDGVRRATAEWHTRGPGDIAVHPLTAYPEPGDLEWSDDGSVVVEPLQAALVPPPVAASRLPASSASRGRRRGRPTVQ